MICYRCFDCLKWLEAKQLYIANNEAGDYLAHEVQTSKRIVHCGPVKRIEVNEKDYQ